MVELDLRDGCRQVQEGLDRLGVCGLSDNGVQIVEVHHSGIRPEHKNKRVISEVRKQAQKNQRTIKKEANPQERYCPFGEHETVYP